MDNYTEINARAIDRWVDNGWVWGIPVTPEICAAARRGEWSVLLTPTRPVPKAWFPPMAGLRLLGLASGGGQQMPIFAVLGAACTVLDISERMLDNERTVAAREEYSIEIVRADMTKTFPFADGSFDLIFHPVSNCYIEDVRPVWRECFRVLRPGGTLLSGLDNGFNYLFESYDRPLTITNKLPYNPLRNPEQRAKTIDEDDDYQFSHSFDEQIGGQLEAGFVITGAYEDYDNDPDAIADGIASYWATRAVKPI